MTLRNLFIVFLFVLVAACNRVVPIKDIGTEAILTGSGQEPTLEEVREGIRRGVLSKTWSIEEVDPYTYVATYEKGKKWVTVTIAYTTQSYAITYRDSENLFYKDGRIHRRYNSWVRGLRKNININMRKL